MTAVYTLTIYLFLVIAIGLLGRRQRGQLNSLDLLVMLLLGSAVETAMVGGSSSFKVGLVSAATLLIANRALAHLACKFPRIASLIDNPPLVLVKDGELITANLAVASLTPGDIDQAIRARGQASLSEVRYAVLEADGQISIIAKKSA